MGLLINYGTDYYFYYRVISRGECTLHMRMRTQWTVRTRTLRAPTPPAPPASYPFKLHASSFNPPAREAFVWPVRRVMHGK